jgi:hypothetical protein
MVDVSPAAVGTPELVGVLGWWTIVLAAPLVVVRRRLRARRSRGSPARLPTPLAGLPERPAAAPVRSSAVQPGQLPQATFESLCHQVDFHRRLGLAVSELERKLSILPREQWRIVPFPLPGDRGNSLLVLGETGVYVISAVLAPGHWDDLVTVSRLAEKTQLLLPRYGGKVRGAICHPFSSAPPRLWYREDELGEWIGAWVLGGDSLVEWLGRFGTGDGIASNDLERFDELSAPNWLKPAVPAPPSWPPVPNVAPRG